MFHHYALSSYALTSALLRAHRLASVQSNAAVCASYTNTRSYTFHSTHVKISIIIYTSCTVHTYAHTHTHTHLQTLYTS